MLPQSDWSVPLFERKGEDESEAASLHCPVSTAQRMPSNGTMGTKAKPSGLGGRRRLCCLRLPLVGQGSPACHEGGNVK